MNVDRDRYGVFQITLYLMLLVALGLHPLRDFVENHVSFFLHLK